MDIDNITCRPTIFIPKYSPCCSLFGDKDLLFLVAVEAYVRVAAGLGHGLKDKLLLLWIEPTLAVEVAVVGGLALAKGSTPQHRLVGYGYGAEEGLKAVGPLLGAFYEEVGATALAIAQHGRVEKGIDFALGLCTEVIGVAHTVVALGTCCCLAAGVVGELFLIHR